MPNDWNVSVFYDPTICTNFRGVSLLFITYKTRTGVFYERLKPLVKALILPYQFGFRSGKITIGQTFKLLLILDKNHEQ